MKTALFIMTSLTLSVGTMLTSCNTPAQKVENAEEEVVKANEDLDEANKAYLVDMETYRKETAIRIAANKESIAAFNLRIVNEKKDAKADYQKRIAELDQKNTDMQKKLDDYAATGKENWEIFKTEFNHDMDGIGQSLKDLTVDNKK